MKRFTALVGALGDAPDADARLAALADYFRAAPPRDAAWAAYLLAGRRMPRFVRTRDLAQAAQDASGVPGWLFAASRRAVGNLAETAALLLPPPARGDDRSLADWIEQTLAPLAGLAPAAIGAALREAWDRLPREGRLVVNTLVTGGFRGGVARPLVLRALADVAGASLVDVSHRLAGEWTPDAQFWSRIAGDEGDAAHRPHPFMLANALDHGPAALGPVQAWQAEWKWDGVRAQVVARIGTPSVWLRGDVLAGDAFPELVDAARTLPQGTVIDGEILAWTPGAARPRPFAVLERRLARRLPGEKLRADIPVALAAFDVLEHEGRDVREWPLRRRRALLESLELPPAIRLSPARVATGWDAIAAMRPEARGRHAGGLVLKRLDSTYEAGRVHDAWWTWPLDPFRIDAVLVYAQLGRSPGAGPVIDCTFAVWDSGTLVPFAKACRGLDDDETRRLDAWVRAHTLERFGPVRRVEPVLVFELAFEGVRKSARHKSGIAVRDPRIVRRHTDKRAAEADALETLARFAAAKADGPARRSAAGS